MKLLKKTDLLCAWRPSLGTVPISHGFFQRDQFFASVCILLLAVITGCAPVALREARSRGAEIVPFELLLHQTAEFTGRAVIVGGFVAATRNTGKGSELVVIQSPLDSRLEPEGKDRSRGRFLVVTERFLDPEVYTKDRRVTVSGAASGLRHESVDGAPYAYPVIKAETIYLWPEAEVSDIPYYPYYHSLYPYPYWWDDPWYPWYPYPYRPRPWCW
ncbi:MAG: Slp family lipoprotein [Deltaproteobacteria bacterium]